MKTIILNDSLHFGSGLNRACYLHPNNKDLCIKVLHARSHIKTQQRELKYFNAIKKRKNISWDMVAPLLEVVETNYGRGVVFEVIRDADGEISKSAKHYLSLNDDKLNKIIIRELDKLKHYLLKECILFTDLNAGNLLMKKLSDDEYKVILIDGVGHNDFLPLCNYSKFLSRIKIKRTWNRKRKRWYSRYKSIYPHILPFNQ